jgi:prepilin-type N-terminal cleavage/methylation domain-containing protein
VKSQAAGFTLIEVILAITILSTLSILTTQAITRALKARTKIQAEVEDVSALRDSMRMIRSDLHQAYHHRDFEKEMLDLATKPKPVTAAPGQPIPPPAAVTPVVPRQTKRWSPDTQFVGDEANVNFVTMNGGRTSSNTVQADFIEVGYSLKSCNNLTTGKPSKCLYRRTQNIIDEDVKTGGNEIVMLENVTEFNLRYIGETKQDWIKTWNSSPTGPDGATRNRFPDAVEVSLTIERELEGKTRNYAMQFVIPLHFPNNPANTSSTTGSLINNPANGAAPQTGGGSSDQ